MQHAFRCSASEVRRRAALSSRGARAAVIGLAWVLRAVGRKLRALASASSRADSCVQRVLAGLAKRGPLSLYQGAPWIPVLAGGADEPPSSKRGRPRCGMLGCAESFDLKRSPRGTRLGILARAPSHIASSRTRAGHAHASRPLTCGRAACIGQAGYARRTDPEKRIIHMDQA
jgi:hypothetical protein